jgi:hypothetical protein
MEINKARWTSNGNSIHLSMPLTKIDKEHRTVSGFATLDNVDEHGDVVMADASTRAFDKFRGNLREMHDAIAAGRLVDFHEDQYFDTNTQKFYDGIFVTAYVSAGAPNTWEKVLDGTLTAFSIGGDITDFENKFNKDVGRSVRFVKDYELNELSLVDNPANQFANIFSIQKSSDGMVMKGLLADMKTDNVFYCKEDELVKTSTGEALDCPNCGTNMQSAGWFEYDESNKEDKLKEVIQKYLTQETANKGGVDVGEVIEKEEVVADGAEAEDSAVVDELEEDKAADVSEVNVDDDLAKMFAELKAAIDESLNRNSQSLNKKADEVNEAIDKMQKAFDDKVSNIQKAFEDKISELAVKHTELSQKFVDVTGGIDKIEKSVTALESATAIKKSNDLGGLTEVVPEKNTAKWGGHFFSADSLLE